jgi:hypothetical protein
MGTTFFTLEHLKTLEEAIASGVMEVKYNDRQVKYNSMNDMLKARSLMRQALGLEAKSGRKLCCAEKGTV